MGITSYGVQGAIGKAIDGATPATNVLASIALPISTDLVEGQSDDYSWLGAIPTLREWVGSRQNRQLPQYRMTLQNKKYETSIEIPEAWAIGDKTGNVQLRIGQMVQRVLTWRSSLIATLLNDAASGTAFDGVAFISGSHSWGDSGTIDNDLTYNASATPTAAECADAIMTAWAAMMGFKDDQGQPINEGMSSMAVVCAPLVAG